MTAQPTIRRLVELDDVKPVSDGLLRRVAGVVGWVPENTFALASTLQQTGQNLDTEIANRIAAVTGVQNNLNAEAATRLAADNAEIAARTAAVAGEATARTNADNTLQTNIDTEIAARVAHAALTANVHGITNTANLVYTADGRLSDQRVPTDGSVTNAKVAANAAIAYSKLNLIGSVLESDLAFAIATQAELDAEASTRLTNDNAESAARIAADALLTPINGIYATAATLAQTSKVTGDANNRWQRQADGKTSWGDGTNAVDTALRRVNIGVLQSDQSFQVAGTFFQSNMISYMGGGIVIGAAGGTNFDTNLYRSAADTLKTDDDFQIGVFKVGASNGALTWNTDTTLIRQSAGTLQTGELQATAGLVARYNTTNQVILGWANGGASPGISFGSAQDTNLYRSAADTLKTDDNFSVAGGLVVSQGANITGGVTSTLGALAVTRAASTSAALDVKVTGDANSRFLLTADGKHQWGDGTLAQDTNLYRNGVQVLETNSQFRSLRAATTDTAFASWLPADTVYRYRSRADGLLEWGNGALTADTNLYRAGAASLRSDSEISAMRAVGTNAFATGVAGDTVYRYVVKGNGLTAWSDGTNAADTNLYRYQADNLRTDDSFIARNLYAFSAASTDEAISAQVLGDANRRLQIKASGVITWGDGTGILDTNLYRSATDTLRTDDKLFSADVIRAHQGQSGELSIGAIVSGLAGIIFGSGGDTNLYRSAADTLKTDDSFVAAGSVQTQTNFNAIGTATQTAYKSFVSGDAQNRLTIDVSGKHLWGDGALAPDTNLYRSAADTLKTDDNFISSGSISAAGNVNITGSGTIIARAQAATSTFNFVSRVSTDTADRFAILADGKHEWGDGALARDTNLYRSAAGTLKTDGTLQAGAVVSTSIGWSFAGAQDNYLEMGGVGSFTYIRSFGTGSALRFRSDYKMEWGNSASVWDTNLYRSAADRLKTDDLFDATGLALATMVKAGIPADADWAVAPPDGTLKIDSTNNRIYARVGGAWKYAALI